jgi:hypothetical protein
MPRTVPAEVLVNHYLKRTRVNAKDCWLWRGAKTEGGYGRVTFRQKGYILHRLIWHYFRGAIPKRLDVCHRCDTPACWNVKHLYLGTRKKNLSDAVSKGRMARGSKHYNAKLRESDVHEIRRRLSAGQTHREVANDFSVIRETVSQIAQKKNWAWL